MILPKFYNKKIENLIDLKQVLESKGSITLFNILSLKYYNTNKDYRKAIDNSTVLCDSQLMANKLNIKRNCGPDFLKLIIQNNLSASLLGGSQAETDFLSKKMGISDFYAEKITLNDFKPTNFNFQENLVLIVLGNPKQEQIGSLLSNLRRNKTYLCIGAAPYILMNKIKPTYLGRFGKQPIKVLKRWFIERELIWAIKLMTNFKKFKL